MLGPLNSPHQVQEKNLTGVNRQDFDDWAVLEINTPGGTAQIVEWGNRVELPPDMKRQVFSLPDNRFLIILTQAKPPRVQTGGLTTAEELEPSLLTELMKTHYFSSTEETAQAVAQQIVRSVGNLVITPQGNDKYSLDFFPLVPFLTSENDGFELCARCFDHIKKFIESVVGKYCTVRFTDQFPSASGPIIVGQLSVQNLSHEEAHALKEKILQAGMKETVTDHELAKKYKDYELEGLCGIGKADESELQQTAVGLMLIPTISSLQITQALKLYNLFVPLLLMQASDLHWSWPRVRYPNSASYQITSVGVNNYPFKSSVLESIGVPMAINNWRLYIHFTRQSTNTYDKPRKPNAGVFARVGGCGNVALAQFVLGDNDSHLGLNLQKILNREERVLQDAAENLAQAINASLPGPLGWIRLFAFFVPDSGPQRPLYVRLACESSNPYLCHDFEKHQLPRGFYNCVINMNDTTPSVEIVAFQPDNSDYLDNPDNLVQRENEAKKVLLTVLEILASVINSARVNAVSRVDRHPTNHDRNFGYIHIRLPNVSNLQSDSSEEFEPDSLYSLLAAGLSATGRYKDRLDRVTPIWSGSQDFKLHPTSEGVEIKDYNLHEITGYVTWSYEKIRELPKRTLTANLIFETFEQLLKKLKLVGEGLTMLLRIATNTYEEIYKITVESGKIKVVPHYYMLATGEQIDTRDWVIDGYL